MSRTAIPQTHENSQIKVPKKSYQVYNILPERNSVNSFCSSIDSQGSILIPIYNNVNGRCANSIQAKKTGKRIEIGNSWMQPQNSEASNSHTPITRRMPSGNSTANELRNCKATNENFNINHSFSDPKNARAFSTPLFNTDHFSTSQSRLKTTPEIEQSQHFGGSSLNFKEWARIYLFGSEHKTVSPLIQRPSQ
jgi:hypothetical protein